MQTQQDDDIFCDEFIQLISFSLVGTSMLNIVDVRVRVLKKLHTVV